MPARPILVDTTRLLTRLKHPAPTGIDRVDLAYARRFLAGSYDGGAVAVTRFGARLAPARHSTALLRAIDQRWRAGGDAETDPTYARLRRWLSGPPAPFERGGAARGGARVLPDLSAERSLLGAFGWPRAEAAPRDAVYLHTSHLRLDRPQAFDWLYGRPDIRPVFFVHDLIPIEFPEYGVPGEAERHRRRMATVARHAAAVVVNSQDVADRLAAHLARGGLRVPPIAPAWLGVAPAFAPAAEPPAGERPYFVVLSTIEARKNHLLLLQVWRDLARQEGGRTPALVIVGRRGWESESAVDLLDRCEGIAPHVAEASGLSDAGLAGLLAGARALLTPSFAEGYGIPIVEALSLGTAVVASDIPAHREIAGGRAMLLDPLDGLGWRRAVLDLVRQPRPAHGRGPYRPPSWEEHFAIVNAVIDRL